MTEVEKLLARSRQDLEAARLLASSGYPNQSISRAYYAVFHAAEATLLLFGEARSKHSGVISAFNKMVIKEGGLDQEIGATLRILFEVRGQADYDLISSSSSAADSAVHDAERFLAAVEEWIRSIVRQRERR